MRDADTATPIDRSGDGLPAPTAEELSRFFELSLDLCCIAGTDGFFRRVNPSFVRTLGYTERELLSRPFLDFVHPDDVAATVAEVEKLSRGVPTIRFENRYRHRDGGYLWLEWTSKPVADGSLYAIARDVTEKKRTLAKLRLREESLRAIFDAAVDGILTIDQEGRLLACNAAAERIFGYAAGEMLGRNVRMLMPEPHRSEHDAYLMRYRRTGDTRVVGSGREVQGLRKDGSVFPMYLAVGRVDLPGRERFTGIVRDISARKAAEEALRQTTEQLARSNHDLELFADLASHDLQEPLRMISSYLELLQSRFAKRLDDDGREFLGYAVDGAERLRSMIQDLLRYSRVGSGGKPFGRVSLDTVLARATRNLEVRVRETGGAITHDPLPEVRGDEGQLVQLLQNLIGNALTYRGDDPPRVHVSSDRRADAWEIGVRDHGIGIAPEHRDRVFEAFQRLHGPTEHPGTGIGLAICRRIVERHGGRIWVDETPGGGATIRFTVADLVPMSEPGSSRT